MKTYHDVISAFIDDEAFDAGELGLALADPEGRALLLDLVALRSLVQPAPTAPARSVAATRSPITPMRALAMAAALLLAIGGGYVGGHRFRANPTSALDAAPVERDIPPAPTREITLEWHSTSNGGH
jgi:hypothetical protein